MKNKPLTYRVSFTIAKPDRSFSVEVEKQSLADAMDSMFRQVTQAAQRGHEVAVQLVTPAGHTLVDYAWWPGKA